MVLIGSAMGDCQVISLFPSRVSLSIFIRYVLSFQKFALLSGLFIDEIVVGLFLWFWFVLLLFVFLFFEIWSNRVNVIHGLCFYFWLLSSLLWKLPSSNKGIGLDLLEIPYHMLQWPQSFHGLTINFIYLLEFSKIPPVCGQPCIPKLESTWMVFKGCDVLAGFLCRVWLLNSFSLRSDRAGTRLL